MGSANVEFWEEHYRGADPEWGTRVNVVLAELVERFAPVAGRALELGCGHGGDALWLAGRGWDVVAVDASSVALGRVAERAAAAGLGGLVRTEQHDLPETFPDGEFDLVCASYFHTPVEVDRDAALRLAAGAVAAGGVLVVVDHASLAPWSWRAGEDVRFPAPEELVASLGVGDGWEVLRCAAPRREARHVSGQTAVVTDNVVVARRLG
ncbi:class I SAM-dependent methyltransferase [Actinokineospora bangkokensis]|uniref:Methyltransferase n=1 Tax=Actinokineospora bangkokensis TaxID=1193682 RepID=A0A1Q9LNK5_9PSEU|nr:methyltransferase domain-containing protein [Actinokineospora bangkokensis]OLR93583.1 methyltransferase [Actinokineospora bangkokensis]